MTQQDATSPQDSNSHDSTRRDGASDGRVEGQGRSAAMWDETRHGIDARKAVRAGGDVAKPVAESRVTLAHIMSANDTNLYGGVHGGVIMKLIDDAAAAAAARHAGGPAVTASVDGMRFVNPALVGDLLEVRAQLARVGRTSMDVEVTVTAQRWNEPGQDRQIVRAFLTFVAVDADGRSRPVAPLVVTGDDEERVAEEALHRRHARSATD